MGSDFFKQTPLKSFMKQRPIQYLLVGLPYSGKTTLAKKLVAEYGFKHINIDELKWEAGYTKVGDDEVPDEAWGKIFNQADKLLIKYLKEDKNVVNEYAWVTKEWRDRARRVASKAGFETKTIYLKTSREEIEKRWRENNQSRARFHWPEKEFRQMFLDFEEPTMEEGVVIYNPDDHTTDLTSWF
jgi:predicted kinase